MRRVVSYATALLVAWAGAAVIAQKVTTVEQLDTVMKKAGPAMQTIQKAIGANAFADAKAQIGTVRQAVIDSQNFWVVKKKEDALKMNKESLARIDAFEQAISASGVTAESAMAAYKDMGGACRSCHQQYRATDADNNYILKPGSVGE